MPAFRDPRSKLWRYRVRVRLPDGRSKRIGGPPRGARTKKAAELAERAHIFRLQNPGAVAAVDPDRKVPTIGEFAEVFLSGHALAHKPREREDKRRILDRYLLPVVGALRLDEIRQTTVDVLRAGLADGRDVKTVDNILSVLSGLMRYAAANEIIAPVRIRFVFGKAASRKPFYALPMEDVERLLVVAKDPRWHASILLAAQAGLRIGEIRGLLWSSVNQLARRITIERALDTKQRETLPKHDRIRTIAMSPDVWAALKNLPQRGPTVITLLRRSSPITYWASRDAILELYARAKVTVPEKPWHALRHTFGTELARAGVPIHTIQQMMGHASIQTTLRYMHTNEDAQRAALAKTFG